MGVLAYFFILPLAQMYLPLPIVHTIGCSSIALVYIMDHIINKTILTKNGILGVTFGFVGVLLMANSRLILSFFV